MYCRYVFQIALFVDDLPIKIHSRIDTKPNGNIFKIEFTIITHRG